MNELTSNLRFQPIDQGIRREVSLSKGKLACHLTLSVQNLRLEVPSKFGFESKRVRQAVTLGG